MANVAEQTWAAFRRYTYKGIKIDQDGQRIHFAQKNAASRGRVLAVIALTIFMVLWPMFELFGSRSVSNARLWVPVLAWLIYPAVIMPLLIFFFVREKTVVDVQRGQVTVRKGSTETFVIPVDEIKNVDVRRSGSQNYVAIWHGPVPVHTICADEEEAAITLKEGMVAAIGVMNQEGSSVTPKRAKTFDE